MHFGSVHNYYEHLVYEEIMIATPQLKIPKDQDTLEDIACVALNRLPARYIRHDIDLAFYLTSQEREHIELSVRAAVRHAAEYVLKRTKQRRESDAA